MQIGQAPQNALANRCNLLLAQRPLVHLDNVRCGAHAILHHQPGCMLAQVTALVFDGVGMFQLPKEPKGDVDIYDLTIEFTRIHFTWLHLPNLLEDVVPLLQALLAQVAHLLNGHNLPREVTSCIIHGTKASMADLPEVVKDLLRVMLVEQVRNLRVLERTGPCRRHLGVSRRTASRLAQRPRVRTLCEYLVNVGAVLLCAATKQKNLSPRLSSYVVLSSPDTLTLVLTLMSSSADH